MPLPIHSEFANRAIEFFKEDPRVLGIAAGGSWITDTMDEFSDVDLVIVVDPQYEEEVMAERIKMVQTLGNLLSAFTGEHVGEPRLIICLYGPPLLHVDFKFVGLKDLVHRVEDPVILWQRNGEIGKVLVQSEARYPIPSLQWMEDRFWVWVHYVAVKIARGELFEAIDAISFMRTTVLGPLTLMKNNCLPRGTRYIERDGKSELPVLIKTLSEYNRQSCGEALVHSVGLYRQLRDYHGAVELIKRSEAEELAVKYLENVMNNEKSSGDFQME